MRVAVGMSGGVDSSVAAYLLKEKGHDVFGVTMKIWRGGFTPAISKDGCYGPNEALDIDSAREVCSRLGIGFHVVDCSLAYEEIVLAYFREEYLSGRTPNPCVRCNQAIKFGLLPRLLRESVASFDCFATGHYARVELDQGSGRFLLRKGTDLRKDQSYFLYRLSQDQLGQVLFPLGTCTKERVREIAREGGLPVHDRKESQDFYGGDPVDLIGRRGEEGEIVDTCGRVLGRHGGIWNYTVGQRKGLGISHPVPLYVISIDAGGNRIVVGTEQETYRDSCVTTDLNWIAAETLSEPMRVQAKVRSAGAAVGATISPLDDEKVLVVFAEPMWAVTPGQSAVFYRDDVVIGGGVIE